MFMGLLGFAWRGSFVWTMFSERVRLAWERALAAHLRAARMHDEAEALFVRFGDPARAARESDLAAAQRRAHAEALALRPEWGAIGRERVTPGPGV